MTKFALLSSILFFIPLTTCHFQLQHPPSRAGQDDEKQATFPCGGFDTIKGRTQFPLTGGSVQLELEHDESLIEVLLAVGNNPGDSFNIVWKPIVQEEGPGAFCLQDLVLLFLFPCSPWKTLDIVLGWGRVRRPLTLKTASRIECPGLPQP